jgi:hypothetical protein
MSWVPCPHCQAYQSVAGVAADSTLHCPACGGVFRIAGAEPAAAVRPMAGTYGEPAARAPAPGQVLCPDCHTPAPANPVLCVHCGLDFRSGKKHGTIRVRRASASFQVPTYGGLVIASFLLGGLFGLVFVAWLSVSHGPVLGLVCLLPGVCLFALALAFGFAGRVLVSVAKEGDGPALCTIVHRLFGWIYYRRRLRLSAQDHSFVFSHKMPAEVYFGRGPIWWYYFAQRGRTDLQIRNRHTGVIQRVMYGWDAESLRQFVDLVRDVEYVPIERE